MSAGEGLRQLGNGIVQASYNLADLAEATKRDMQDRSGLYLETRLTKFRAEEEQRYLEARDQTTESAIGFTRSYLEGYQQRADEFIKQNFGGVDERQNQRGRQALLGLGNSLYSKANSYETKAKLAFYDREVNSGLDTIRTQIRNNAAPYDELKAQGLAIIDSMPNVAEAWKAERRAMWASDAKESQWQWAWNENPAKAIADIRGGREGYYSSIRAAESGGNDAAKNPNSSATGRYQFTSGTWDQLRQKHPEAGLTANGRTDPAQQEIAIRLFTEENAGMLEGAGIPATNGNLYAAHFLGAGGAKQVLSASDDAMVSDIVSPAVIKANPFLRGKSVADFKAWASKKAGQPVDYSDIPYDRREQLANWGQAQYDKQQTQQRTQTADMYRLMIATEPENVSQDIILKDNILNDGDKASLINTLNAKNKEAAAANAIISSLAANGSANVNPFDAEQRKAADSAYAKLIGGAQTDDEREAVTRDFVSRTGYVPKQTLSDLRNRLISASAQDVASAAEASYMLAKGAPQALRGAANSEDLIKAASAYDFYANDMGLSPEQIGRKIQDMNDPEKLAQREAILKSDAVKERLKQIDSAFVADQLSVGTGRIFDLSLGVNEVSGAVMAQDYRKILEESLIDSNGDFELATRVATDKFAQTHGPSPLSQAGKDVITYLPATRTYPAMPDGTHDYLVSQALDALSAEGIVADKVYFEHAEKNGMSVTEQAFKAGGPVPYQIYYEQDGKVEAYPFAFVGDYQGALAGFKGDEARKRSIGIETSQEASDRARKQEANRQNVIDTFGRGGSALGEMEQAAEDFEISTEPLGVKIGGGF